MDSNNYQDFTREWFIKELKENELRKEDNQKYFSSALLSIDWIVTCLDFFRQDPIKNLSDYERVKKKLLDFAVKDKQSKEQIHNFTKEQSNTA